MEEGGYLPTPPPASSSFKNPPYILRLLEISQGGGVGLKGRSSTRPLLRRASPQPLLLQSALFCVSSRAPARDGEPSTRGREGPGDDEPGGTLHKKWRRNKRESVDSYKRRRETERGERES